MSDKLPTPGSPKRRIALRIVFALLGSLALVALLATRPWSPRNSFRQMRIFAPDARVENFRTMDELFPSRTIRRPSQPHHFDVDPRPLPASFSFDGRQVGVDAFLDRTVTTGLLILEGNTIRTERYFRDAREDTPMTSWSVAKSVVSLLVGIAQAEGHLGELSATLGDYVPDFQGTAYGKVSLRDALTMSSGIAFSEEYDNPLSDIHTMFARIFYLREGAAHYLASRDAETAPGARFHYASADTFSLGLALRNAIGRSLTSYLEEKLWLPLGMEYEATWNTESDEGAELGFCCLNIRLRDFAKLGRLVARGGDWDGRRIVPETWIRESTRIEPARAPGTLPKHSWGYQYKWWIPDTHGTFMAAGVWGQFIYVSPQKNLVIVKTSVDPKFMAHSSETIAFFEAIRDAM